MEIQELKNGRVSLTNVCHIYEGIKGIFDLKHRQINKDIKTGGKQKKEIKHGDYGYFLHEGEKLPRLFLNTNHGKLEAFCMKAGHHKCNYGVDVNENPKNYFICGNIFDLN